MEFVTARELRLNPKGVWKKIQHQTMSVVTINGKPSFLLSKLDPQDLEEILYIQNRIRAELALGRMQEAAARKGLNQMTSDEINSIIKKTRQARKK